MHSGSDVWSCATYVIRLLISTTLVFLLILLNLLMSIGRLPRTLQCHSTKSFFSIPLHNGRLAQSHWLQQQRKYVVPTTPPRSGPSQGAGATKNTTHSQSNHTHGRHTKAPTPRMPPLVQPQSRHEIHEGTIALNIPYNPPGGGVGPNIPGGGGGGGGSFTSSPMLDAILTTVVGLGAGVSRMRFVGIIIRSNLTHYPLKFLSEASRTCDGTRRTFSLR